jgi:hypothetical protein
VFSKQAVMMEALLNALYEVQTMVEFDEEVEEDGDEDAVMYVDEEVEEEENDGLKVEVLTREHDLNDDQGAKIANGGDVSLLIVRQDIFLSL